ncbi:hypothetical protein SDC9_174678 [bioreactor metagenome]|uniref:Uncharacterized protein n=1 Tax=bioreactor metagenome TaxID=1076179 RepID=A0A645GM54_9ZZZZ
MQDLCPGYFEVIFCSGLNANVFAFFACLYFIIKPVGGDYACNFRQFGFQHFYIIHGEIVAVPDFFCSAVDPYIYGAFAYVLKLPYYGILAALPYGYYGDHRGYADDYSQHGEKGAHFIGSHAVEGRFEAFYNIHILVSLVMRFSTGLSDIISPSLKTTFLLV